VRRRQGRARRHRQVPQAGVELYGASGIAGDVEILRLAASVARSVGLTSFVVDLGHAAVARSLLEAIPAALAPAVSEALAQKDGARMATLLASSGAPLAITRALSALPELHGADDAVFERATPIVAGTPAEVPVRELRALWDTARRVDPELAAALRIDLGEVRGFAYYTGAIFHLLAPGPGEPVGAGGRYDDLLARFDAPMPAVGFALHLDAVAWARDAAGAFDERPPTALVVASEGAEARVAALRAQGIPAVLHPAEGASEYARAWRFSHLIVETTVTLLDPESSLDPDVLARLVSGVR
jgi:ATP phosphoribosyltransferase regulatory subunit